MLKHVLSGNTAIVLFLYHFLVPAMVFG